MKKKCFVFGMLLLASTLFAKVQFKWDFGTIGYGYNGQLKNITEIDILQIGIIGKEQTFFLNFSPLSVCGNFKSGDQQIQFQNKELFLLNFSAGYIFRLGSYFIFEPNVKFSWLEPTNLKNLSIKPVVEISWLYNMEDLDYIPNLMQRLITISVGTNLSSMTNFKPQLYTTISANLLWFLPLVTN